jgi:hypothetical protein
VLPAAGEEAGAEDPVAGALWRGGGEPEREGDGPFPVGCARAVAGSGGTVTTAGGTATARPAWLAAQDAVPAAPHPAAVVRASTVPLAAGPEENTPRVR